MKGPILVGILSISLTLFLCAIDICEAEDLTLSGAPASNSSASSSLNNLDVKLNLNQEVDFKASARNEPTSNTSIQETQRDKFFSVDKAVFENYFKSLNLGAVDGIEIEDDYIPSDELQRDIPAYMAGFDKNNRPVWIAEVGKWKFTKYAQGGQKTQAAMDRYLRYFGTLCVMSQALRSTEENRVNQHVIIIDTEGLQLSLLRDAKVRNYLLRLASWTRRSSDKYLGKLILLNLSQIPEALLSFSRFLTPRTLSKIEVYGTNNKAVWAQRLVKDFHKDQIPEWYGGSKAFQPLYVLG